ncbi:response regulator transcription factor [Nocardia alni]|uniref:response regulator transcription factor n=1 Tax=Nocardia alni TaxID=2815723 RepID=UPI001C213F97|nr:response regulator transcription factor [Nocardia alni]
MIRILIADDEQLIRDALATLIGLEEDLDVVSVTGVPSEVVGLANTHRCDVALLDIDMAGTDGIEIARRLCAAEPGISIIMLTSFGKPGYLKRAVAAGARGFVTKDISAGQLARVIREVHAGGRYLDPQVAADAMFAGECPLGPRELEVLRLAESGRTVAEMSKLIHLTEGTIRNYLSAAITKLGADNKLGAISIARNMGWL